MVFSQEQDAFFTPIKLPLVEYKYYKSLSLS